MAGEQSQEAMNADRNQFTNVPLKCIWPGVRRFSSKHYFSFRAIAREA